MSRAFGMGQNSNDAAQHSYPPSWAAQNQAQSEDIDGSEALFTMYMERAEKDDKEMAERLKADADSILVFSGLFSATVAAALGLTFPDLKPDPQDKTNFYLAHIYELLAKFNESHIAVPTTLPHPPEFIPSSSALYVNMFWFWSLLLSLICALFAILLQQWARLYLTTYHTRRTLLKEARLRQLLAEGVNDLRLSFIADVLRLLHHTSFFLFLAGLAILLFNTNVLVFGCIAPTVVLFIVAYMWFTYVPMYRNNGPYSTPFSPFVWYITLTSLAIPRFISRFTCLGFEFSSWKRLEEVYRRRRSQGMTRAAEETAQTHSQVLDQHALVWTFKSLTEDQELERFITGIPSFCSSKAINDPSSCLAKLANNGLSQALFSLMHRTLTSNLVSEPTKQRRIRACTKAIDAAPVLVSWQTLHRVFLEWDGLLESLDFGRSVVRIIGNSDNDPRDFCAGCIVAVMIARSQEDGGWSCLPTALLGISEDTLFRYNIGGLNNVRLATLIFTVRQVVRLRFDCFDSFSALFQVSTRTLDELLLSIDVQRASSELQQDFCGLWNELVHTARDRAEIHGRSTATEILKRIRRCYIAFHENTDPSIPIAFYETANDHDSILSLGTAYPLCEVESHHPIPVPAAPHSSEGTTDATVTVTQGTFSTLPAIIHPSQRHHPCLPDPTSS